MNDPSAQHGAKAGEERRTVARLDGVKYVGVGDVAMQTLAVRPLTLRIAAEAFELDVRSPGLAPQTGDRFVLFTDAKDTLPPRSLRYPR